ncbi:inactive protein tyrosine kinase pTKL-like isoform X2 [Lineus longissimus]
MKMKWKQFVAHSLPRSWTKSKKRTPLKQQNEKILNEDELNQNITKDAANIVEVNKSLVTDDFCYLVDDNTNNLKQNYILVNNLNINDQSYDKWTCQKRVITNETSDEISNEKIKNGNNHVIYHTVPKTCPYIYSNDSEEDRCTNNDNNTIPKTRSRIKTNPWLPSPRITPNPSPSPSCSTSSYSSPTSSRSRSPHSTRSRSRSSSIDKAPLSTCSENDDCSSNDISVTSDATLDVVTNDIVSQSEGDLKQLKLVDGDISVSFGESKTFGFYESLDDLFFLPEIDQGLCDISPSSEPSFAYEEAFESQVENIKDLPMSHSNINSNCSSLDQLSGVYQKPLPHEQTYRIETIPTHEFHHSISLETSDANHNIISKTDDESTAIRGVYSDTDNLSEYDNFETPQCVAELHHINDMNFKNENFGHEDSFGYHSNEYSESEDEYYIDDVENEDGILDESTTDHLLDGMFQNTEQEPLISPYQPAENKMFGVSANHAVFDACARESTFGNDDIYGACANIPAEPWRRSIGEIQESIGEKVMQLRKDKNLVEEKIRQAREEERIRMQEKLRFQQQVTLHRKQMLLRTLSDLRRRLEGQCQRLQDTYSGVLYMQRHSVANSPHHRPQVTVDFGKEAPF